jgi:hypothetical protein
MSVSAASMSVATRVGVERPSGAITSSGDDVRPWRPSSVFVEEPAIA